jgi:hypothetical protein
VISQRPPERLSAFARRLLLHEADAERGADLAAVVQRMCGAMHERLAPLISSAGYHALLGRALKLASRDFPFLANVSGAGDPACMLEGLAEAVESRDRSEVADALTALLAHFMWLLVLFIGEQLGLGKVREAWPEVPLDVNPSSEAGK